MKQLVIIGAGGLGKEVLWAAANLHRQEARYVFIGFCDDAPSLQSGEYCGLPLLGELEKTSLFLRGEISFVCAVGDNSARKKIVARAESCGWKGEAIIDPSVLTGPAAAADIGSYVGALSILSPGARLGRHVIVNHGCSIGHDSRLGDFSQVCPGGRVSGHVELGEGAFLGSNAVVAPGLTLGAWSRLGAASFALRDIAPESTAVGNPARAISRLVPAQPINNEAQGP